MTPESNIQAKNILNIYWASSRNSKKLERIGLAACIVELPNIGTMTNDILISPWSTMFLSNLQNTNNRPQNELNVARLNLIESNAVNNQTSFRTKNQIECWI